MFVLNVSFGDFVVWTKHDLVVVRVFRDDTFLETQLKFAESFFVDILMPELLGQYCTLNENKSV